MKNVLRASEFWMGLGAVALNFVKVLPAEVSSQVIPAMWTYVGGRVVSKLAKANIK